MADVFRINTSALAAGSNLELDCAAYKGKAQVYVGRTDAHRYRRGLRHHGQGARDTQQHPQHQQNRRGTKAGRPQEVIPCIEFCLSCTTNCAKAADNSQLLRGCCIGAFRKATSRRLLILSGRRLCYFRFKYRVSRRAAQLRMMSQILSTASSSRPA